MEILPFDFSCQTSGNLLTSISDIGIYYILTGDVWFINERVHTKFCAFWQQIYKWKSPYKILCLLTKMVKNLWQSVDAILGDVSLTEQLVDAKILI